MFSAATFTNINGTSTVDLLGAGYSVKKADWSYEYDGSEFPKQQDSGNNPGHSFVRRLVVDIDVQIKTTSFATYWVARQTLVEAFLVEDGAQTDYPHGRVALTPISGTAMYADVNVTTLGLPLEEETDTTSTMSVALRCDRGYWLKVSDDTVVRI